MNLEGELDEARVLPGIALVQAELYRVFQADMRAAARARERRPTAAEAPGYRPAERPTTGALAATMLAHLGTLRQYAWTLPKKLSKAERDAA